MWYSVAHLLFVWAPPQEWPETDGKPIYVEKALQVLGETFNKASNHMAAGALSYGHMGRIGINPVTSCAGSGAPNQAEPDEDIGGSWKKPGSCWRKSFGSCGQGWRGVFPLLCQTSRGDGETTLIVVIGSLEEERKPEVQFHFLYPLWIVYVAVLPELRLPSPPSKRGGDRGRGSHRGKQPGETPSLWHK